MLTLAAPLWSGCPFVSATYGSVHYRYGFAPLAIQGFYSLLSPLQLLSIVYVAWVWI